MVLPRRDFLGNRSLVASARVQRCRPFLYYGHWSTDGGQKRITCVLQELPTVGNLGCIRKRFRNRLPVSTVLVSRDNRDLRMLTQPGSDGRRLAIWQQVDNGTPFEIADQRPIALSVASGPIIGSDDAWFRAMVRAPGAALRRKVSLLTPNLSRRPSV